MVCFKKQDLNKCSHCFVFRQYYKDYSITSGEDRVQISSIEVVGTTFAEVRCNLCPLGWHQDIPMSNECKPCIPGTYSDILGATTCKSCGVGQTSYYGSSSCFFQRGKKKN